MNSKRVGVTASDGSTGARFFPVTRLAVPLRGGKNAFLIYMPTLLSLLSLTGLYPLIYLTFRGDGNTIP